MSAGNNLPTDTEVLFFALQIVQRAETAAEAKVWAQEVLRFSGGAERQTSTPMAKPVGRSLRSGVFHVVWESGLLRPRPKRKRFTTPMPKIEPTSVRPYRNKPYTVRTQL